MKIAMTSVFVDDQTKAAEFYSRVLGFQPRHDIPMGEHRWLTVVSPEDPDGVELVLEPNAHPAAVAFQEAMVADGIPVAVLGVADVAAEHERLAGLGVTFTQPPTPMGPVVTAVFDDTCGNLVQLVSPA
ncbi:VOC family protein [Phycicoccus sp. CSK15P-2]|uniref:VOC family protein n=1 Tax=Phycicoccus sp. CSK15P-2 TaxID=2807627 RepID=UPI0019515F0A|nr:VOC family protein [Phycicoccus sp. CSK15P-2]MBM6403970.1 VOC family protein [Phycicoccus sp. CSK15P-2]